MSVEEVSPPSKIREPVLILARLEKDRVAIENILTAVHVPILQCSDVAMLCEKLPHSLTVILTVEAIATDQFVQIQKALIQQPPWSDIPLIVLTGRVVPPGLQESLQALGNITLLERPLHPSSLLSLVKSAVRARRRQWQVRDLLAHNQSLTSELRRAMTETHHRIKNNLQLVAALVDYQLIGERESVSANELRRIGLHIQTLATIHDILTYDTKAEGQGNCISTKAVLERLLPLMQQTAVKRQLHFQVDDTLLSTRQGTALAIITNELISNALKYATRDIEVVFAIRPPRALLTVQDDGPGFPDDFTPVGGGRTGLEIVTTLTGHDLSGELYFANAPQGGGVVKMSFPIQD
jgi:two-component sensor histidine kinase